MKSCIQLLLLVGVSTYSLASPSPSRRRYGDASGGFVSSQGGFGGRPGGGGVGGASYSGGTINFPDQSLGRPQVGVVRPHSGPVGTPSRRPVAPNTRPVAPIGSPVVGGGGGGGGGFRPSTECSPRGCPVGPGEPTVTFLDECYNLNTRGNIHESYGNKVYHYSWCVDGGVKYNTLLATSTILLQHDT
ncbi:hypothetical protein Pmani_008202 [Petrolisthes manimaculis]|uniref:Uncharacterized protein n=1 Tax=Petrolisthes manimaculis TaxID=1843537 RepID=A0AAE1Q935_9EUCA|nr:hypothetical protein Pmani_008202 [Petrolisthes manimaculis]